jgi:hypothetical protein
LLNPRFLTGALDDKPRGTGSNYCIVGAPSNGDYSGVLAKNRLKERERTAALIHSSLLSTFSAGANPLLLDRGRSQHRTASRRNAAERWHDNAQKAN